MKKICILILGLVSCNMVMAAENNVLCPATLTCNYDAGTCELPAGEWKIDDSRANDQFDGTKQISLKDIEAEKQLGSTSEYQFSCSYGYETDHGGQPYTSYIIISTTVKNLGGDKWTLWGFGKRHAYCDDEPANPTRCFGVN